MNNSGNAGASAPDNKDAPHSEGVQPPPPALHKPAQRPAKAEVVTQRTGRKAHRTASDLVQVIKAASNKLATTGVYSMNATIKNADPMDISESDVIAAMKDIQGYVDISPGAFREVFHIAYKHALERIRDSLKARDIMTSPVQCVSQDMDLIQLATFLADKRFSGTPVVDGKGSVVGVLSEKDVLARMGLEQPSSLMQIVAYCLQTQDCAAAPLRNHAVREIMTAPAVTAGPEVTMGAISALFIEKRINRLPIVDPEGRPLGIVTRTDLVRSYCLTR